MADHQEHSYGEGSEDRIVVLMHVLQECARDADVLAFGLQHLGKQDEPPMLDTSFLCDVANRLSARVAPYLTALSNEYLQIRQAQRAPLH